MGVLSTIRRSAGLVLFCLCAAEAGAEPYLAVREGLACSACHVNPSGAGLRTAYGNVYAQQQLAAASGPAEAPAWTGMLGDRFALGANARVSARQTEVENRDDSLDFGVDRVSLYLGADLGRTTLYLDQQVAPGGSLNREAWAKVDVGGSWYAKAGRMFLPFGWRLEDDTAFVRQATGVTLTQGDDGLEVGFEGGGLSWQLAVTNGNGGGPETDDGKLFSTRGALIRPGWQAGVSVLHNNTDQGRRAVAGVFLGLRTGLASWLAEYDHIDDEDSEEAGSEQGAALVETNLELRQGHNLKLTAEGRFFDDDRADRYRYSAVYEYSPWAFIQFRLGLRARDSDDADPVLNDERAFLQLHAFF